MGYFLVIVGAILFILQEVTHRQIVRYRDRTIAAHELTISAQKRIIDAQNKMIGLLR